jgi:recombinational DNA repair ATPase RecF
MPLLPGEGWNGKGEEKERFLDWLCFGPERQVGQSQNEFAKVLGVGRSTLGEWKRDHQFRLRWEARLRETVLAPDIIHDQLRTLHEIATSGEAKDSDRINAITQYQKLTGAAAPERHDLKASTEGVRQMSDEELMAELQARVGQKALNA